MIWMTEIKRGNDNERKERKKKKGNRKEELAKLRNDNHNVIMSLC
jgi:hypothetical protein